MAELVLKVDFSGDVRRLPLPGFPAEPPISEPADMLAAVRELICRGFSLGEDALSALVLKYTDDEGDSCTLVEEALADALKLANGGPLKLLASLQTKPVPTTKQPAKTPAVAPRTTTPASVPATRSAPVKGAVPGKAAEKGSGKDGGKRSEPPKGAGKDKGRREAHKGGLPDGKGAVDPNEGEPMEGEFQACVRVGDGEELDLTFDFREKILGDQYQNVRHIRNGTGARVWLRGRGAGFAERNSSEPLHLFIASTDQASVDRAVEMSQDLLRTVIDEYNAWLGGGDHAFRNGKGKGKGKPKGKGLFGKGFGKGKDEYSSYGQEDGAPFKRPRYTSDAGWRKGQ